MFVAIGKWINEEGKENEWLECDANSNYFYNFIIFLIIEMNGSSVIHSNKQRGIYSEIIIPDNSAVYQNGLVGGPD